MGPCAESSHEDEVHCVMGNGHMGPPVHRMTDIQTQLTTLPSHNFVGGGNNICNV